MLEYIVQWIVTALVLYLSGHALRHLTSLAFRIETAQGPAILYGMVFCTVYAECFSLFAPVGAFAFLLLVLLCLISALVFRKEMSTSLRRLRSGKDMPAQALLFILLLFYAAFLSSGTPKDWDSYNYHAQAIRWIEEYGLVKGLGNLHTRFAYNSSFLCLQALFSFRWTGCLSSHALNGFFWLYFSFSCIRGLFPLKEKKELSFFFRLAFLYILFHKNTLYGISSPNTDFLPMCLVISCFLSYSLACEKKELDDHLIPISLLAVFSVSVKLSAAAAGLFCLPPLWQLLKKKKTAELVRLFVSWVLVYLPCLIRGILLSGYPLYPSTLAGLPVDWRIPEFTAESDSLAIKLFARFGAAWSYSGRFRGISEWFPLWLKSQSLLFALLTLASLVLSLVLVCLYVRSLRRKTDFPFSAFLLMTSVAGLFFMLLSAPSTRFGLWWICVLPTAAFFFVWRFVTEKRELKKALLSLPALAILLYCLYRAGDFTILSLKDGGPERIAGRILCAEDYDDADSLNASVLIDGQRFYYYLPDPELKNSPNGYRAFPGTETLDTLQKIELRGSTLAEGFRAKPEEQTGLYDFQGKVFPDGLP